jgi:hypothetical protein
MKLIGRHGCRLGCIVLLATSCESFQSQLPSIVPTASTTIHQRLARSSSSSSSSSSKTSTTISTKYYQPKSLRHVITSSSSNLFGSSDRGDSTSTYEKLDGYPLGITRHYFEEMEERSGKDYSWIKPLTQPVSDLMM